MGADALREPMEYRGDLQIALEHAKAALDVGQALVALHDLRGAEVADIGQQHQLAVETLGARDGVDIDVVAEAFGLVIGVHEPRQFRLRHGPLETAVGAAIAGLAAACGGARSEEHTSELQSLMRISYAVFCL